MAWKWVGGLDGFPFNLTTLDDDFETYYTNSAIYIDKSKVGVIGDNALTFKTPDILYPLSNGNHIRYKCGDGGSGTYFYTVIEHSDSRTIDWAFTDNRYAFADYLAVCYNEETKEAILLDIQLENEDSSLFVINRYGAASNRFEYKLIYEFLFGSFIEASTIVNSTDYTLYIDGDRLPNYNLNWNPDTLGEYGEHSQVVIEFRAIANNPLLPTPSFFYDKTAYTNGFFKFNWSEVWQKLNIQIPIIDDFLTNEFTIFIHSSTNVNGENIKPHTSVAVNLLEKKNINGDLYRELVTPSSTGDTLTIDFGEGKDSDDYYNTDSGENDEHSATIGYDIGTCNLTACYELSVERLNNIASKLWSNDFFDNILLINNSPIENILSCKLLPISLSGIESSVKIGNVDMGINANRLNSTVIRYNIGNISIPRVANMGFLNYAPYTTITIFLPFIGFKELNTSDVMGRNISVDYIVDVITGACKCCIDVNAYQCYEYDGNCGIDIPLTSSNRSQVEMGYVQSALGVVTNIGSSNYSGAIGEAISGAMQQYHYNTNGSYSPSTGAYEDRTCFIIIDRPQYSEVTNFGHTKGYKCQLTKTIKNLNGFLKTTDNVDLSNISAPKFCKDKILELLSSGVYV